MDQDTKTKIMENQFVFRLRAELVVDEIEYDELCAALKELAVEWKPLVVIDKELMSDLYVLASIARNMAPEILGRTSEIEEMATEIDGLVIDCLSPF